MTNFYTRHNISIAKPQVQDLTAVTVSKPFTAGTATIVYYNGTNVGTLQCTFDNGATWINAGSATAKTGSSVITNDVFEPYKALAAKADAFRVSFGTAFTGKLIVEAILE